MTAPLLVASPDLAAADFRRISEIVYRTSGIVLPPGKEGLVRSRLAGRLRELGVPTFGEYVARVGDGGDGAELARMVDLLTTNKTSFYRERAHFDYLRDRVLPALRARGGRAQLWSAGCSSGEEPYTLAMLVRETAPANERLDWKILATDLSARVLARARAGTYDAETLADVPAAERQRWFEPAPPTLRGPAMQAREELRRMVSFARLNLMDPWPMRGPFDAILCRNVMIYFDRPTQERLVGRFWELLAPGGTLFVGHSESLTGLSHRFRYVQPAVYER